MLVINNMWQHILYYIHVHILVLLHKFKYSRNTNMEHTKCMCPNSKLQPTRCNVSWFIYFCRRSTCFRQFLLPSSGAHNCTYSFRYFQPILLLAATMEELEFRG